MSVSVRDSSGGTPSVPVARASPDEPACAQALPALRARAKAAWREADPAGKCLLVDNLAVSAGAIFEQVAEQDAVAPASLSADMVVPIGLEQLEPGRPSRPLLVQPSQVSQRATAHATGRAALLHAIAHIEFNAINLALDAVWRYPAMPPRFVTDWLSVAADEARHFRLLTAEMAIGGHAYGDFSAHDGLWVMARKTAPDLLARMALVPRVLEARGLDATPVIQKRLRAAGDKRAVQILQVILDEEIGHVRIGGHWFDALCAQRTLDPQDTYRALITRFDAPRPRGPLNLAARRAAGFSDAELDWLQRR